MQFFRNQWILGKIHQRFDKIQMKQKGASCTNSDYKKMANLGDKGKFWQKWRVLKIHQGFGQIFKKYWKWHVDSCRFLGTWHFFVKIANLATIHLRFAKIQMRWPTRHIDRWRFLQKWQIWWKWRIWEGVINEWLAISKWDGDVYENGKFWPKWQNWEEYMKGLKKIQEIIKKATLTINKHF